MYYRMSEVQDRMAGSRQKHKDIEEAKVLGEKRKLEKGEKKQESDNMREVETRLEEINNNIYLDIEEAKVLGTGRKRN